MCERRKGAGLYRRRACRGHCFAVKPSSAIKPQVRQRPQHVHAWQGAQTDRRGCLADEGECDAWQGRRSVMHDAQTDGRGLA
jgi:hypothetical protein